MSASKTRPGPQRRDRSRGTAPAARRRARGRTPVWASAIALRPDWQALRRIPRAAWVCALIAVLNAACWSIVNPPFQIPDEPAHFAYTQQLAENAALPTSSEVSYSPEEEVALHDLHQYEVHLSPEVHTISTAADQQRLQEDLAKGLSRHGGGGVNGAYSSPPLFYLLQIVPYALASGGTLLDQLQLMRLLSALMAGVTALFAFLFVRETLPSVRWAWTVGGLAVAVAPLLGFISGAMNPDAMLTALCAVVFYCLARAFRRGLTRRGAVALGALMAAGFLTKLNFIGLAPGIVLGLVVLSVRAARTRGRAAYVSLAMALAIAASPLSVYILANLVSGHPALGAVSGDLQTSAAGGPLLSKPSYVWQLYLPPLPGMHHYFPGLFTAHRLWFDRIVGYYGWLDTSFPLWVDTLALLPAALIALLCLRSLLARRAVLTAALPELGVYAAMGIGLLALIGLSSFFGRSSEGLGFAEPRYLLPLLPLLGAVLALAARGGGPRWGQVAGTAIVAAFIAHDLFSQVLVVGRFYS